MAHLVGCCVCVCCVLCFVLSPKQSGVLECHLSHILKDENMSYVFWRVSSLWPEKKVLVVCLAGAQSLLRPEKKSSSRLSGGYAIVITTGKKRYSRLSVGCAVLAITTINKKKIQSSVCWVRGSGDYNRKKKRYSCLFGGCAIIITTGKKKF